MFWSFLNFIFKGPLSRALDTVDRKIEADTDREKLKADILREHIRNRADWMRSGGFVLMLIFAIPLGFWHAMVIYDTALGCVDCVLANSWTVAELPEPLDEWAGWIVVSIFGVIGVDRFGRK